MARPNADGARGQGADPKKDMFLWASHLASDLLVPFDLAYGLLIPRHQIRHCAKSWVNLITNKAVVGMLNE